MGKIPNPTHKCQIPGLPVNHRWVLEHGTYRLKSILDDFYRMERSSKQCPKMKNHLSGLTLLCSVCLNIRSDPRLRRVVFDQRNHTKAVRTKRVGFLNNSKKTWQHIKECFFPPFIFLFGHVKTKHRVSKV